MPKRVSCFFSATLIFGLAAIFSCPLRAAQVERGVELYEAKKYQEAEKALREVLDGEPDNLRARYYLGLSLVHLDRHNDALAELKRVDEDWSKLDEGSKPATPSKGQIELALGRARMGLKQYDEAWQNLEAAKDGTPDDSDVYLYRGIYYVQQRNFAEAVKELEKAISLDPQNVYAHYYAGIAYSNIGRPDKMVGVFQTFLKLAPNAPEAPKVRSMLKSIR